MRPRLISLALRTFLLLRYLVLLRLVLAVGPGCRARAPVAGPEREVAADEWPAYGRNAGGTRYFAGEITPETVARLAPAWTYHTGEDRFASGAEQRAAFESTPLVVDGGLYLTTPFGQLLALDPATGRERWRFDPKMDHDADYSEVTSRGAATWLDQRAGAGDPCRRRLYVGTLEGRLLAVGAGDGAPCLGFGADGVVDLADGIGRVRPGQYQLTSPPAVVGDVLVVGSSVGDNGAVALERGVVRGYDARSGAVRWRWDPIPHDLAPAARDRRAWAAEGPIATGAANAWAPLSADPARGLVFVPTGSPSPDYHGGARPGSNAHANSVVALRAATGALVWSFQVVHHDLWDYDVPAQPMLISFRRNGVLVDAVAVATKIGHLFLLDRDSGQPLFPVEERPVPASDVEGEAAWPTQPFPTWPPALVPQRLTAAEAWGATDGDREACRRQLAALRSEGLFTPPSVRGTVVLPSQAGGMNWSGMSYDEPRHLLLVNANNIGVSVRLIPRARYEEERRAGQDNRMAGEFAPQRGAPYGIHRAVLRAPSGAPCTPPPWGTLTAVDLDGGRVAWSVPLGSIPQLAAAIPGGERLGSPNMGGTMISAGVVFVAAAMDEVLRAFDTATGKLLWQHPLPASAQAAPMTYRAGGRQYVVIAAGGHGKLRTRRGDTLVAFALPP